MSSPAPRQPANRLAPRLQEQSPGLDLTVWRGQWLTELHLTVRPLPGEPLSQAVGRVAQVLKVHQAVVVRQEVVGRLPARPQMLQALAQQLGPVDWPVTCVEGAPRSGELWAGTHLWAVSGRRVQTLRWNGRVVGRSFDDGWMHHLLFGDVLPTDPRLPKSHQAMECFRQL